MIESVYSSENAETNRTSRVQGNFRMPKNIRQIGKSNASRKIYVEDYVMTFTKQLAMEDYSTCRVAVLLGQYIKQEDSRCIFISGAVRVEGIDVTSNIVFTNDHWTSIYESIKNHFVDAEIVGWFLGGPGYLFEDKEKILKAHVDNFAGQDKTLLVYDNIEKEETFYLYENSSLCLQEGYYIYYEKNEEMQDYMIGNNQKPSEEADYDDHISKEIRTIIQNKKPVVDEGKSINRLMYAAGTLLAVIILVVGAAILSNYDQMKNMQDTLNSLSKELKEVESVFSKDENKQTLTDPPLVQATNIASSSKDSLDIEVVPGGVTPLPENNEDKDVMSSVAPESQPEDVVKVLDDYDDLEPSDVQSSNLAADEVEYYTVQAGDSLAGISYKLYDSANYISKIKELNNIDDEDMIYIGQKLKMP